MISQNLLDPGYSVLIRMEESIRSQSRKIASLSPDLVMKLEEWSEPDRLDSVVMEKIGPKEFRFRLYGAMVSDSGFYFCDVTAWTRDTGKEWTKAVNAASNRVQISITDTGDSVSVEACVHLSLISLLLLEGQTSWLTYLVPLQVCCLSVLRVNDPDNFRQ